MIPGITLPSDYARLALKVAPWLLIALLVVGLLLTRARLDAEKKGRAADRQAVATAQAEAKAADLQHARDVEAAQNRVREEVSRDLEPKLAAARAAADDYARRLRDQAAQGGGGKPRLPSASPTPVSPSGAGETAELDDLRTCAEAVVKAEGWPAWWAKVSEEPR